MSFQQISPSARKRLAGNSFNQACMTGWMAFVLAFTSPVTDSELPAAVMSEANTAVETGKGQDLAETLLVSLRQSLDAARKAVGKSRKSGQRGTEDQDQVTASASSTASDSEA